MAGWIDGAVDRETAFRQARAAAEGYRKGEEPAVTAARRVVAAHERDPLDGTVRVFGGRDEARLASALTRVPEGAPVDEIEGRLKADVAIQRMASVRAMDIVQKGRASEFERRDVAVVGGDASRLSSMASRYTADAVAVGRFSYAAPDVRDWAAGAISAAGERSAAAARGGVGDRMASIGGFMPGRPTSSMRPPVMSRGPAQSGTSGAEAASFIRDRAGMGR